MVFVSDAIQKFYYSRYGAITRRPWLSYGSRSAARVRNANQMTGLRNYEYRVILCGLMKFLQGFLCVLYISSLTIYYYETVRITPRFDGNRFPGICLAVFFFSILFRLSPTMKMTRPTAKVRTTNDFVALEKKKTDCNNSPCSRDVGETELGESGFFLTRPNTKSRTLITIDFRFRRRF